MKRKSKFGITLFIIVVVILMLISFTVEIIQQNKREKNLYNIQNPIVEEIDLKLPAIAIFNEFVMDNFNGLEIEKDNSKIYRVGDIVENTENNEALNAIQNLLNVSVMNIDSKDINEFNSIKEKIFNKDYNNLNVDYINGVNPGKDYGKVLEKYIKSYVSNHSVFMDNSGYIVNYYDGYENLFDINNLSIDLDTLIGNKELNKMTGLKYVDNKMYHIVTYIEDLNQINIKALKQISLNILKNNKESDTLQAIYEDILILDKGYLIVFKLFDGIEESLENRFFDIKLNLGKFETYKIPSTAITQRNGVDGVLYLKGNIIKFTPVKIEKEEDDYVYISNDFSEIFPNTDTTSIEFENLHPFTKIIKNPINYSEGEIY